MLENPIHPDNLVLLIHPRLLQHLKPGMQVLDLGCGDGAFTRVLVAHVLPGGCVVGFDRNLPQSPSILEESVAHLKFMAGDFDHLPFQNHFDLVSARKVLMWQSKPLATLEQMVQATAPGGKVVVVDVSKQAVVWNPPLPPSVQKYHGAYSRWRLDLGFNDAIGEHLPELFRKAGLVEILIVPVYKKVFPSDPHFDQVVANWLPHAGGWADQVVSSGYLDEGERQQAEHDFNLWLEGKWLEGEVVSMFSPLVTVEGTKSY